MVERTINHSCSQLCSQDVAHLSTGVLLPDSLNRKTASILAEIQTSVKAKTAKIIRHEELF